MIARRLAVMARHRFTNVAIAHATLPTEWTAAPLLLEDLLAAHRPDIALHFGVSHQAEGFVVETSARNIAANVDASGSAPIAEQLIPNQPYARLTSLPTARIVHRLRRMGLPACLSHDAGAYLCNAIYFHSLRLNEHINAGAQSAFIHLPAMLAARAHPLSQSEAVRGGLEIIATALKLPPAQQRPSGQVA